MRQVEASSCVKRQMVWRNVILFAFYHLLAFNGLYYALTLQPQWKTYAWFLFLTGLSSQGITSGAHRLWSHRCYKAKLPLRIFLCICQTLAFQNDIFEWARDHRVHHKFTDTNADPYNSRRGFYFSHMGWLLERKHPDVISKGKTVDVSDLLKDPVVVYQKRFYVVLAPLLSIVIPGMVPIMLWNEDTYISWCFPAICRYMYSLHCTWLVNSAAHMWGMKPYDTSIEPVENKWVSFFTFGEGWHNYHHTFPWDYKAAELHKYQGNLTTGFIDLMAKFGLAYDLKTASQSMIQKRKMRTGLKTADNNNGQNLKDDEHFSSQFVYTSSKNVM